MDTEGSWKSVSCEVRRRSGRRRPTGWRVGRAGASASPRDRRVVTTRSPTATSGASRWPATHGATTARPSGVCATPTRSSSTTPPAASYASAWSTFDSNAPNLGELPGVCAHYIVKKSGAIAELVPPRIRCRHAIGLNHRSIGIEMVQEAGSGPHWADREILDRKPRSAPPCASCAGCRAATRSQPAT